MEQKLMCFSKSKDLDSQMPFSSLGFKSTSIQTKANKVRTNDHSHNGKQPTFHPDGPILFSIPV